MDSDGFFTITDRKKDMIVVSGFKVFPNEVEAVVAAIRVYWNAASSACRTTRRARR